VLASGDAIRAHALYLPTLVLFLLGAFTKSAQVPFHFWLPRAMAAPTPISAYLHSATMVKAGVFLLARFFPVFAGTDAWFVLVGTTGMATLLYGASQAMWQHDLKGLLAYSTISHLGLITLLFGFGTQTAAVAAVFHIVNHATFKASLFMAAGIIDHEVGTRDMRVLNGLWRYMPYTGALAIVAAGAMAGVPLLNGFLSKEMFFAEALEVPRVLGLRWLEPALATLAGALSVGYSLRFIMEVFFNRDGHVLPRTPHEPPRFMLLPVEALVLLCVTVGVAPNLFVEPILTQAAAAVLGGASPDYSLALWHGFNLPLLMTVVALAGGVAIYAARERLYAWHDKLVPTFDAAALFDRVLSSAARGAAVATRALENGSLQRYIALVVLAAVVAGIAPIVQRGTGALGKGGVMPLPDFATIAAWVLLLLSAGATVVWHRQRLTSVIAISAVGLFIALAFVRLAAPDLALTQLLVEVVTILLLLLALHHLPSVDVPQSSTGRRVRDAVLATVAGGGCGALAWLVMQRPANPISEYYLAQSLPKGGGTNVVNVILVDFRAFDTLGEVAVLGAAALGVVALLEGVRVPTAGAGGGRPSHPTRFSVILAMISRPFLPLALLISAYLLLRGHDLPGGGFAAGLLTAVALIVQHMSSGAAWTGQRLRLDFRRAIAVGVLLAVVSGVASWGFGRPLLTSYYDYAQFGDWLKVPLSSALVFDLGVYLTVVGAVMLILERIARLTPGASGASRPESANSRDAWKH
jgi:multicomponent K+:H+ antiporter subunit A